MSGVRAFRWVFVLGMVVAALGAAPVCAAPGPIFALAVDPMTPVTVYAGGANGTFKSTDGGATWSLTELTDPTYSLVIDPVMTDTVYAGTGSGIFKSTDGGANWSRHPTNAPINSLAIDFVTPTTVYAGTSSGVLKSTDGGANWSAVGLPNVLIYSLAIDSVTPTTLYTGSVAPEGLRVFQSTDGGQTWSPTGLTSAVWGVNSVFLTIDPVTPTILYAAHSGWGCDDDGCFTLGVISKSTDAGANWFDIDALMYRGSWVSPQPWPSALAVDPKTSATLYAAWSVLCDGFDANCQPANWTNKSTDGGTSWVPTGAIAAYTFAIDPVTPTVLYAGTESGVFKSIDGGATWNASPDPTPAPSPEPVPEPADTAPPDTFIISATDGDGAALPDQAITVSTSVTMTFTGTDNRAVARFECRLDGAGFSVCVSPLTHTGLAPGRHTVEVRAIDTSNNVDPAPARLTWTVDAPPDTSIISAMDGNGTALPDQAITLSTALTLTFTGVDDRGVARFECRLDGASFSPCTSPRAYTGLAPGRHTVEVRAIDTSNSVDPTPARHTWTVDAPPDTSIISALDARGKPIANGGITTSRTITLRFTGTDNGTITGFECRLDAGNFTSCLNPLTYTAVSRGTHTFQVRAIDNNGFRDPTPAIFKWRRTNDD